MATPAEHRAKALHNEKLLNEYALAEGEFAGWAITVLYYCAVHLLRALAAQEGFQIKRYKGKDSEEEAWKSVPQLKHASVAYDCYNILTTASRSARYEMKGYSALDYKNLRQNFYEPFRSFVTSHLHP